MGLWGLKGASLARARVCLIVVPSFLLFGYNQSKIGGILSYPTLFRQSPNTETSRTTRTVDATNVRRPRERSSPITLSDIGNRIGRRESLMIAAAIAAIGQIISGIGNGGECTAPKSRGKNVGIIGIFISSGIAAAGWVNVGSSLIKSSEIVWRFPLAVPIFFGLMIITFTLFFPEPLRWLISKGRLTEAHEAMRELFWDTTIDDDATRMEIDNISSHLRQGSQSERGFLDLLKPRGQRLFYRMCLAIGINFCAQMTGAIVISYYESTTFKKSLRIACPCLIIACLSMGLSMAALAGCVWSIDYRYTIGALVAATFFLLAFMTFFPLEFLGANFLYSVENAPQDLRIQLTAIGSVTHWLFNFVIVEIIPIAFVTIRWKYYVVYAVIRVSVAGLVYFLFPETNCRSLQEMDELFSDPTTGGKFQAMLEHCRQGSPRPHQQEPWKCTDYSAYTPFMHVASIG
ncbi:MFS general substrate transporter [Aspergillus homomorphus CBS 101889]|uniref:MFS general substrate transporter n=1 Tax=Aspergillus homomorphus (strain CBS 101889) TaxID=1450537 RepID=A0A395IBQ6_ASPHC|nr:MFS general substrate transporter [Aspergillus homomorphus CBS 101889]RAL17425.1 MFS general substrate transporter [Aspergillus homomorphus CBS 101889]